MRERETERKTEREKQVLLLSPLSLSQIPAGLTGQGQLEKIQPRGWNGCLGCTASL